MNNHDFYTAKCAEVYRPAKVNPSRLFVRTYRADGSILSEIALTYYRLADELVANSKALGYRAEIVNG
jgi:hypothetical protein